MAIRFKTETYDYWDTGNPGYTDDDGWAQATTEVPIREWSINPESLNIVYDPNQPNPQNSIKITFPELSEWNKRDYDRVSYELQVLYQGSVSNWLGFSGAILEGKSFKGENIVDTEIRSFLQNIASLTEGTHTATVCVKAFENKNGEKIFIENSPFLKVVLKVKSPPVINTDYRTRQLTYNKSTGQLTGDVHLSLIDDFDIVEISPSVFLSAEINNRNSGRVEISLKPRDLSSINLGIHQGKIKLKSRIVLGTGIRHMIDFVLNVIDGQISPIFEVEPTEFSFSLAKGKGEIGSGTANIFNPNHLTINIGVAPSFLENVRIENGQLKFQTKNANDLLLGDYSGEIVLHSGNVERRVKIAIKVVNTLKSDFEGEPYHFALDKKKVVSTRTNAIASYVTMCLEMYYKGFGEEYLEKQVYAQHYFKDTVAFFPGDEVQDFFIRCKELKISKEPQFQFNMAVVNIIIKEYSDDDKELSESRLDKLLFVPGKKPLCYPIFTDFAKRRTFSQSKIRLNTDAFSVKNEIQNLAEKYTESIPSITHKQEVYAFDFERNLFNASQEKAVLVAGKLSFIPFPNPPSGKLIHLFFENQNLVLDWFSCPMDYQRKFDFTHIINESNGEKFGALETETLIVNTGWILREEIELINAILKSRICFIMIEDKVIKARPISKKNEIFDTKENLYSMDLEFNIKQNER